MFLVPRYSQAMEKATKAQLDKRLGINTDVDVDRFFDEIERLAFAPILVIVPSSVIQVSSVALSIADKFIHHVSNFLESNRTGSMNLKHGATSMLACTKEPIEKKH